MEEKRDEDKRIRSLENYRARHEAQYEMLSRYVEVLGTRVDALRIGWAKLMGALAVSGAIGGLVSWLVGRAFPNL